MVTLRKRLPPANSLITFEASARHLNFTHAAAELLVTQAAVSRQIQLLEDNLGCPLFERRPRGLELTLPGRRLREAVTMGLGHIATTAADLRRVRRPGELTVSTSVTFANYWLMSRVAKFRAANPDVQLRLVASAPVGDLTASGIDLAVRYGSGVWDGAAATRLMDNEVFPVCAPSYIDRRRPLGALTDLLEETLLHLIEYDSNWVTWEAWLAALGIRAPAKGPSLEFDNYLVLTQAVLDGQGIALGGGRLAEDFLARGLLIRPIEARLRSERSFYLLVPKDQPLSLQAEAFRRWILEEARENTA
ncbi:LysR family transcriptional regulator [Pelagibius litoralis]|uniref:LysR family transcriptional regulator n=1 Tax=Pelagibius litoralis TaxID=374515 RepID=A0A967EWS2_9PROT|nr:LysR substrate-binding domain-containing protein [Pelagibius litoralis]NIA68073.1 LysR family transcriptional regulator [Pelagibius litoralis]